MSDERHGSTLARVAGIGAGLAAAWLVQRLIDSAWKRAAGHPRPAGDDDDTPLAEVALATVVTGAVVGVARLLASRGASRAAARLLARP